MTENIQKETIYLVVANDEQQFSIWPFGKEIPAGWRFMGKQGIKADCLEFISKEWIDMRPLTLQKQMSNTH